MTSPIDAHQVAQLQASMVQRWHQQEIDNPCEGFLALVCQQHQYNYRLWHQEDLARSPDATDARIADVKRQIDRLNQQRNDMIEQLDDAITRILNDSGIRPAADAPMNSETAGSVIDRLSILSLRLYHYQEQLERQEAPADHRQKVADRIAICRQQHADLTSALDRLLDDLFAGRKCHKTYRQLKMYNDPSLNPSIYQAGNKLACS